MRGEALAEEEPKPFFLGSSLSKRGLGRVEVRRGGGDLVLVIDGAEFRELLALLDRCAGVGIA
ncbi:MULTISPECIES: hypothetical protein [unclassified Mesorhizobium]|uniref:hypothetical protein n=1 Tax=unclassified Mesorhizobium TaxID=325217 RepID=UPI0015E3A069|nr:MULTISPECIES: hypothetical protein [unclassified Mesorhizobium]